MGKVMMMVLVSLLAAVFEIGGFMAAPKVENFEAVVVVAAEAKV